MPILSSIIGAIGPKSSLTQVFPPSTKFHPEKDIVDPTQQSIMVTGFNSGIGYETAKQLALRNAGTLYLGARSQQRGEEAISKLKAEVPNSKSKMIFVQVDLSDLKSIRQAADKLVRDNVQIHVLYNNAGVAAAPKDALTAQGYDMEFGINVIGTYFLTKLLRPTLEAAAAASGKPARIVNTSSYLHVNFIPGSKTGIEFVTIKGGPERDAAVKKLAETPVGGLYGQSKLGNIFISDTFATWNPSQIHSCAVHPGIIGTNLMGHMDESLFTRFMHFVEYSPWHGALTQLYAGNGPVNDINGKYYIPFAREGSVSKQAQNKQTRKAVIDYLEEAIRNF